MVSVCCCFKCFYWYLMTICIFLLLFFSSSNRQWFKRILSTLGYVSFHLFKTTALVWKISNGYREHCNDKPNQLAPLSSPSRKKKGEKKREKCKPTRHYRGQYRRTCHEQEAANFDRASSNKYQTENVQFKAGEALSPPLWKPRASELVMWDVKQKLSPSWRPSLPEPPGGGIPN